MGFRLDLLDESWPIYARSVNAPPAFLGRRCQISHSAFNRGSDLEGTVENSVLAPQCHRGGGRPGQLLRPVARGDRGARRRGGIRHPGRGLPHRPQLPPGRHAGETAPDPWGLTVLAPGCVLEDEKRVRPGVMLNKNGEEVSR